MFYQKMFISAIPFAKILFIFDMTKSCAKNVKEFILLQHFEAKIGNVAPAMLKGLREKVLADSDFCENGNLYVAK